MPSRRDLQELAKLRLAEARALHATGLHTGAYYLAGYVVETALKACVCAGLHLTDYPESELNGKPFKTHKWEELLLLAGLRTDCDQLKAADPDFNLNWSTAKLWNPEQRYQLGKTADETETLLFSISSDPKGVLPWLSSKW